VCGPCQIILVKATGRWGCARHDGSCAGGVVGAQAGEAGVWLCCLNDTRLALPVIRGPAYLLVIDHTSLSLPIMSSEDLPLPYGWIKEVDPKSNHPFWVCDMPFPSTYCIYD